MKKTVQDFTKGLKKNPAYLEGHIIFMKEKLHIINMLILPKIT